MDYVALNPPPNQQLGVLYNSNKIGGIRYYVPKKESVILSSVEDEHEEHKKTKKKRRKKSKKYKSKKQVIVYVDENPSLDIAKDLELAEKIFTDYQAEQIGAIEEMPEPQARTETQPSPKLVEIVETETIGKTKSKSGISYESGFLVKVVDTEVDFAALGIPKAKLSKSDERWLYKAQYYFLNVKENGRKIGSAEAYTNLDILYGLWSTAEHVGIDPKRFLVQVFNESRFNPNLKGRAGERGIGQFKHGTAKMLGYDWSKMKGGHKTYAYQALASAEFVKSVGEKKYNGAGHRSNKYVDLISKRLRNIERSKV